MIQDAFGAKEQREKKYIDSDANSKILTYIHDAEEIIEFDIHDDSYKCEDGDVSAICECDGNCDCKDCEYSDGVDDEIEISDLKVLTFLVATMGNIPLIVSQVIMKII